MEDRANGNNRWSKWARENSDLRASQDWMAKEDLAIEGMVGTEVDAVVASQIFLPQLLIHLAGMFRPCEDPCNRYWQVNVDYGWDYVRGPEYKSDSYELTDVNGRVIGKRFYVAITATVDVRIKYTHKWGCSEHKQSSWNSQYWGSRSSVP